MNIGSNYDVIVAGAGPAGFSAAVCAAREGAKVLLIESSFCVGGMSTSGMVPMWAPFTDGVNMCSAGICTEMIDRWTIKGDIDIDKEWGWITVPYENLKVVYDEMLTEYGVDVLFGSFVCGADVDNGKIKSVKVANKNGIRDFSGNIFVDATGDGDLSAFAGAEFEKGDEDGKLQAATLCFSISNVCMEEYNKLPYLNAANPESPIYDIIADERYPDITDDHFCYKDMGDGTIAFNAGHIFGVDSEDVLDMSKKIMLGRQKAYQYRQALVDYFPKAFGNSVLASTATNLGTRESRRIKGDYVLSALDYLARSVFDDEIARGCYYIDVHASEADGFYKDKDHSNESRYEPGESYGIPYRCLTAKGFDNLLTAGRIISCDRQMYGSIRVMPNCLTTGQAAGVAAAMASKENAGIRSIDVNELRAKLIKSGAYIK